jgi:hypothetical protein
VVSILIQLPEFVLLAQLAALLALDHQILNAIYVQLWQEQYIILQTILQPAQHHAQLDNMVFHQITHANSVN